MPANDLISIAPEEYRKVLKLMGNRFEITVVANDQSFANESINEAVAEIRRIEALLTTFNESSQTSLINENAGLKPVKVDREVVDLIQRSKKLFRSPVKPVEFLIRSISSLILFTSARPVL